MGACVTPCNGDFSVLDGLDVLLLFWLGAVGYVVVSSSHIYLNIVIIRTDEP